MPNKYDWIENVFITGDGYAFDNFRNVIEQLDSEQLRAIASIVGISFGETPPKNLTADDYRDALDETTWAEFAQAYEQVTGKRFSIDQI